MGVRVHSSHPFVYGGQRLPPAVLTGHGGMNGLFEVSALKGFLWDLYNFLCLSLSLSKLSDTILLWGLFGEGGNIQIHDTTAPTLSEAWKIQFPLEKGSHC